MEMQKVFTQEEIFNTSLPLIATLRHQWPFSIKVHLVTVAPEPFPPSHTETSGKTSEWFVNTVTSKVG